MAAGEVKSKRTPGQTGRRAPMRAPYDKVLIVCEGERTEPHYFRDLIKWHDISSVNVHISGDCGSAPTSVVQHGFDLYDAQQKKGVPYDRVYCVFDRDSYHLPSQKKVYQKALHQINTATINEVFFAANSIPCFEYWLLLHFHETRQQFAAQGNASVGKMVEKQLRKYWSAYAKATAQPYSHLKAVVPDGEEQALASARRALIASLDTGDENPSTKVHELVAYLIAIKAPKKKG